MDKPLVHMTIPKPTPHRMHLQKRTEEEMGYFNGDTIYACRLATKTHLICYDVLSCHIIAPWMSFYSSMI